MSGGYFDYCDSSAKNQIFDWSDKPIDVFEDKEISELIWDVFSLIHDFDWYQSGDTCEETYLKSKMNFKKKWFNSNCEERTKRVIDESIKELKQELYKTYGIQECEEE